MTGTAAALVEALTEARERTLFLVAGLGEEELERVHSPLMSPLAWDLGHIAAFEDLWLVHRYGGRPLLRQDLVEVYDAMETPRAERGELPFLPTGDALQYLREVRARTLEVIDERGVGDGGLPEMVLRHEHQHNETMLQTLELAGLEVPAAGRADNDASASPTASAGRADNGASAFPIASTGRDRPAPTGLEMIDVRGGPCLIGAAPDGFAYDNERPRHRTDVRHYAIGQSPITNATYLTFVEGGGYERREWWSDEGWAWKEQYDITRPRGWTADHAAEWRLGRLEPLHPGRPVVHVSWFEADAFARAHGARLPTEHEWEKAATWDQEAQESRAYPWGNEPPRPGVHANVDQLSGGTAPADACPEGASPYGCLGMVGDVWEWTASEFAPYPGFSAFPYREYSEPFFASGYRVLRGGSWATRARIATPTFRNWDHPQRRQIFAGLRIARDS